EAILAHELAHIRRHDYLINLLQCLAETFLFYHPAVWWVSRRIREERENCCDDLAVSICGDRLAYVRTLAIIEELRSTPAQLAMAADGAPLLQRIRRLLGHPEKTPTRAAWPLAGIVALVLMAALAIGLRSRAVAEQTQGAFSRTNSPTIGHIFRGNGSRPVALTSNAQAQLNASKRLYKSITESSLPQVNIKCKFVEWDEQDTDLAKTFGFLGLQNPSRGQAAFNPISRQPGTPVAHEFTDIYSNQITNSIGQTFSGILTEPQYRVVLKMLEKHDGVDLLTPLGIITESARQAQISLLEMVKIRTNSSPGTFKTSLPVGPVLDVVPKVGTNGSTVELSITTSVTILLDESTAILPAIQFSQMATSSTVEDGQTVAMAGLQGPGKDGRRKWLMVFVTPTLINPDGSLFHRDDHASKTLSSPSPKVGQTLQDPLERSPERTNSVHPAKGRQAIISKLDHIRIDSVRYDALPLVEVINQLSEVSRTLDPNGAGINFLISREPVNPATGSPAQQEDIGDVTIKLRPALRNVRLADVLDAIVNSAEKPLKYSIEDYAVVFSFKGPPDPKPLFTRVYLVGRDKFEQGIEKAMGITFSNLEATAMSKRLSEYTNSGGVAHIQHVNDHIEVLNLQVRQFLQAAGADFDPAKPSNIGKSLFYNERKGTLMVHTSREDLEVIDQALATLDYSAPANNNLGKPAAVPAGSEPMTNQTSQITGKQDEVSILLQDGKLLFESGKLDTAEAKFRSILAQDSTNATATYYLALIEESKQERKRLKKNSREGDLALHDLLQRWPERTNSVHPAHGRQAILFKLDHIRIDSVMYDTLPLVEVINNLSKISQALDADKAGINFFINKKNPATFVAPGTIDPATGLLVQQKDIGAATIRLSPALKNVRLADVLDAIVKNADIPLKYSIEDYAVVFACNEPDPKPLLTRVYHIDRDKFEHGIEKAMGITFSNLEATAMSKMSKRLSNLTNSGGTWHGSFNGSELRNTSVRQFFQAAGADFDPSKPSNAGKSMFYNERKGALMVHTSREDLDVIEQALMALDSSAPANQNPGKPAAVPTGSEPATNRVPNNLQTNNSQQSGSNFSIIPRVTSPAERQP
ncbi:MAG: Peptidase BlaR1, partial [Pedosphaera sp.]|nr:Peptidase BlaR1 [Pedosphaera sp.]